MPEMYELRADHDRETIVVYQAYSKAIVYRDVEQWRQQFEQARVHVQWDPERSLRGEKLAHRSIQVGISRHVIEDYVSEWIVEIRDDTPLVRKLYQMVNSGQAAQAKERLPKEKIYPVNKDIATRIGLS